ncbi:MAG: ABC transporter permease [Gemmatimonadaceae bacterium]|nr:ABC transporter permease [Gemmatimonadaceae bacterium]
MGRAAVVRLLHALGVIAVVVTLTFALARLLPGDPFASIADHPSVDAAWRARLRTTYGFDEPLLAQFVRWCGAVLRGDLGYSFSAQRPVRELLAHALPWTLLLSSVALTVGGVLGIALGSGQAVRRGGWADRLTGSTTLVLASIPDVVVATAVLVLFGQRLRWFPIGGATGLDGGGAGDVARHLVLPAATLALLVAVTLARFHRAAMVRGADADYLLAARASGLSRWRIFWRHALPNAIAPTLTVIGVLLPILLTGTIFVEKVFAWPGMGSVLANAVLARDYHVVTAVALLSTTAVVVASAAIDALLAWLDPRTRAR